ncbi:hypothetical protein [Thermocoleostomius sinensis]|uniref:Uncharacterized protein n=1 Tax=Thermocoleostomius sinensis A174 TaxID=2016057 RepID=A0A9E8ZE73_9CYAN|nr:hypothetical protein [Thermocoleostomius sinensis]WAL61705.1 hypothetical protein OXH18_06895 [Thermocoleostomius sinensis A174]
MIQSSSQTPIYRHEPSSLAARILQVLKLFWQFSNFYGEYNSRPPSQRRKFVSQLDSIDASAIRSTK